MDIGLQELFLISIMALIILGPERLPSTMKQIMIWTSKIKNSFNSIKKEFENELDLDSIQQQIHNEKILKELGEPIEQLEENAKKLQQSLLDLDASSNDSMADITDTTESEK
ncbi:MAG: Sec-independent protein translocase protein TatB [Pseudomonadota bacterium]|nr:Sec-independent protein translocase protein TatB [Pseudomonadota bacterium]